MYRRAVKYRWWLLFGLAYPYGALLALALSELPAFGSRPGSVALGLAGAVLGYLWWVLAVEVEPEPDPPGALDGETVWNPWVFLAGATAACLATLFRDL